MLSLIFLVIVVFFTQNCLCHSYSPGSCPYVEPIPNFDMAKFLGRWYAMQKTSTESSCLIYDFKEGERPGEYLLEQRSERYPTKLNISYVFDYTGKIKADKNSSSMTIHFPLNVAGSASFDVVTTDYKTYAGIYTCQNLLFFKRQSATFLSRTNKLDEITLKKMRHMFEENLSDLHLNTISHDNCNEADSKILLAVKSNLASSINFSRVVPTLPTMTIINPTMTMINSNEEKADRRVSDVSYEVENKSNTESDIESSSDVEHFIEPRFYNFDDDIIKK